MLPAGINSSEVLRGFLSDFFPQRNTYPPILLEIFSERKYGLLRGCFEVMSGPDRALLEFPILSPEFFDSSREEIFPVEGLSPEALRANLVFPFYLGSELNLAFCEEKGLFFLDHLEKKLGQSVSNFYRAEQDFLLELIQKYYEAPLTSEEEGLAEEEIADVDLLRDLASEAPVVRLVNRVIREAVEARATDIHFEPLRDALRIRYRIDGVLHEVARHPKRLIAPVISRLKLMAKLNIAEHRLPQDGRILFRTGGQNLDIRVSVLPTVHGEGVVLRLLVREKRVLSLEGLGLFPDQHELFLHLISRPNGIILVTGPTGSGKTTTLYAAISLLNSPDRKIITIEDPVEYQIPGINQIHVKPEIGLTFAAAIRSILRHDPDIILVGEIRDLETAEIAIQAALTGHLVFSTLHTNDALGAVARLSEMGIESYLLAASAVGLVAQRLVRRLCPKCRRETKPSKEFLKALAEELPNYGEQVISYEPVGCDFCAGTGYRGRLAIYEIIPVDTILRRLILDEKGEEEMRKYARKKKYLSLFQDGLRKAAKGLTTFQEVLRVARA